MTQSCRVTSPHAGEASADGAERWRRGDRAAENDFFDLALAARAWCSRVPQKSSELRMSLLKRVVVLRRRGRLCVGSESGADGRECVKL